MEERRRGLNRRTFLKTAGAASAVAGAGAAPVALAGHWFPPDPNSPPGHYGTPGGTTDEGDVPQPTHLPQVPWPTVKTEHDRGDAIITRYQGNLDATDFGCEGDLRTGLVYVSQRFSDHVAVFDRRTEQFGALWNIPTQGMGAHAIKVDAPSNSVWFSGGEGARVGRLVLHPETKRPHNFVEYSVPGDVRTERKPHGLLVLGDEVWYTDDRGDRTGWVDVATGFVGLIEEDDGSEAKIESDGINVETAFGRPRVWIGGGNQITVVDAATKRIERRVTIEEEPGFTQLRVHDIHYEPRRKRVYVLLRGSDHIVWFDARRPDRGPQEFINPGRTRRRPRPHRPRTALPVVDRGAREQHHPLRPPHRRGEALPGADPGRVLQPARDLGLPALARGVVHRARGALPAAVQGRPAGLRRLSRRARRPAPRPPAPPAPGTASRRRSPARSGGRSRSSPGRRRARRRSRA